MLDNVAYVHNQVLTQIRYPDMVLLSRQLGGRSFPYLSQLFDSSTAEPVQRDNWPRGTPQPITVARHEARYEASSCIGTDPRSVTAPVPLLEVSRRYIAAQRQISYMTQLERSFLDVTRTQAEQFFNPAEHQARHESVDRSERGTIEYLYQSS